MPAIELHPETRFIDPFAVDFDLVAGIMKEPKDHLVRRASDMKGHYQDQAAFDRLVADGNPLHYEVFEVPVPHEYGHLMYCISKLQAGKVGDEYFMTKGHYHSRVNTGEIYLALRGEGLMMMKTSDGQCRWERFAPGRMVYVPPYWGHRSINTGSEPLISFCVYPGDAGHNYGDIEKEGFPKRAFDRGGQVVIE
ncbi:glucose-6-phosphate isomerase [Verrucomicrobium sp. GAS474]|uniref:glucose-6-phosphate isomerase family protein n=1 Tax=Verrucomicrobium sp. GAS474 TaxID=1882831 RepID=UPI00087B67C6|nr:glucose-6-phosphate isomerase family protein [Verrucomicrobium sp. GAS474]SDT98661.1 glucose-6-phosphate isomerase [Verrucomicrobium sp. GAS474]